MDIFELANMIGTDVQIRFMHSWMELSDRTKGNLWLCDIDRCETKGSKKDNILSSIFGQGKTPQEALNNACASISNKLLVYCGGTSFRKEYQLGTITGTIPIPKPKR